MSFEHDEQQRLDRARAHLARVRDRRSTSRVVWKRQRETPREPRQPIGRGEILAVLGVGALLGLLLGDGWLVGARDLLSTNPAPLVRIAVDGTRQLSAAGVARATGVAPGTPLSEVDAERIAALLRTEPWIRSARALRLPGGALLVSIQERVAAGITLAGEPAQRFAVDASGTVFAPVGEALGDLPRVVLSVPAMPGAQDARLAQALGLVAHAADFGLATPRLIAIAPDARGFTLQLPGLETEFVLGNEALAERVERLSRLLAERPAEVASSARVDLRFEDQVVLSRGAARKGSHRSAAMRGHAAPQGTRFAG